MNETNDRDLALSVLREIASGIQTADASTRLNAARELLTHAGEIDEGDGKVELGHEIKPLPSDIGRHIYGSFVDACHGRVELLADGSPDNPLATIEMVPGGDITLDLDSAKALRKLLAVYIDEVRS